MKSLVYPLLFISGVAFSQESIVLQPGPNEGKDAMVFSEIPGKNYGNHHNFDVLAWTWRADGFDAGLTRCFIQFNLSEIPPENEVLSAKLSLYNNPNSGNNNGKHSTLSGSNKGWITLVAQPWYESSINWDNQPWVDNTFRVEIPESRQSSQNYEDLDVTELIKVQHYIPDMFFGMSITLQTEEHYRSLIFASSDHEDPTKRPKLTVIHRPRTTSDIGKKPKGKLYSIVQTKEGIKVLLHQKEKVKSLQLLNSVGKSEELVVSTDEITLNQNTHSPGVYLLVVEPEKGKNRTQRLIIR